MTLYIPDIPIVDFAAQEAMRDRLMNLDRNVGAFGALDVLALRLAAITGKETLAFPRKNLVVIASDYQITGDAEPSSQERHINQFINGQAPLNALARQAGVVVSLADLGLLTVPTTGKRHQSYRVAKGSRPLLNGPVLSIPEVHDALLIGMNIASLEISRGVDLMVIGYAGHGHQIAAAASLAALFNEDVTELAASSDLKSPYWGDIAEAIEHRQPDPTDPIDILRSVSGLSIAGLTGLILGAAAGRLPIIIDDMVTGTAAYLAAQLAPPIRPYLIAGHRSSNQGPMIVMRKLGLRPLMELGLAEGPLGLGGVLATHLVEAAARAVNETPLAATPS